MGSFSVWHWIIFFATIIIWLIPVIIANARKHRNAVPILLVTLFLGWTGIGWLVALIWSLTGNTPDAVQQVAPVYVTSSPPAPPPTGAGTSLALDLKRLAELRDSGALTQEEFERSKARLLG